VDCRSSILDQRDRGRPARFFTVAGTSCPSPSPVGRRGLASPTLTDRFTATSFAEATEGQEAAKVAKERGGDGIVDRRSSIANQRDRGRPARFFFTVAGTSCPSPSLEHPAPSRKQPMNPPLLQIPPTSMFNVGCSMFDVRCSFSLSPKYLNLQSSNVFSPFSPNNL
jgi:hypothetical protein